MYVLSFIVIALSFIIWALIKLFYYEKMKQNIEFYEEIVMEYGPDHPVSRSIRESYRDNKSFNKYANTIDALWKCGFGIRKAK